MKKIEKDLIIFCGLLEVLKLHELKAPDCIKDYDGKILVKWFEEYFPEDDTNKIKDITIKLMNKLYKDIRNKK